ncbi:Gfo/Idh/MocA family protein [Petrocella sp. FN5]|uniref:Gfo/Idh/MocA family protein n=1 Tax=Petrocella sp. FN5 TaxID=3032002 RepID=UPI0023DA99BC|nr:Gfo/Idh/MocA family oxidoreductase [Petrocella sp. FN5]MDF1616847.1 Gfo/Idh/MocA family oxidoreductase [Petrocella sp. FN5]
MRKLGIAIIGLGAISSVHIEGYLNFKEQCDIRVLCDMNVEKADKIIKDFDIKNATVITDWQKVLDKDDIDLVSICLPPSLHATIAKRILESGKNVLIEKPMALSLKDCDDIIRIAEENKVLVSVVSQNRYKIPVMKVKQIIDRKIAGPVLTSIVNSFWWRGGNYYDIWWRGKWQSEGGGCLMNHSVHHIDLLQWINGMPSSVTAVINNLVHDNSECEDHAVVILQYPQMTAQLTSSLLAHNEEQELIFQTTKCRLSIPWKPAASKALANGFPEENTQFLEEIQAYYESVEEIKYEGHTAQILNVIRAINGEEDLLIDGNEGRKTIEIIMAIYKSALLGRTVDLPLEKEDDFYNFDTFIQSMPHFNEKTISTEGYSENVITLGRNVGK